MPYKSVPSQPVTEILRVAAAIHQLLQLAQRNPTAEITLNTRPRGSASSGFGLVGRVIGVAAGSRNLAAGIDRYAAALSFYENFLRTGHDVEFPKDRRIEIETTPLRASALKPEVQ